MSSRKVRGSALALLSLLSLVFSTAAMAQAVERPIPGKVARSVALSGKRPSHFSMTSRAQRCRLRARA